MTRGGRQVGSRCLLADGHCDGFLQRHHLIPKREIRSRYKTIGRQYIDPPFPLTVALADERNLVPLCHMHHGRVEMRRTYIVRAQLPDGLEEFAAALGLGWYLDRYYAAPPVGKEQ